MTLQDLLDTCKEEDIEPANVIVCDVSTLKQFEVYQMTLAKLNNESVGLIYLSVDDFTIDKSTVIKTLLNLSEKI